MRSLLDRRRVAAVVLVACLVAATGCTRGTGGDDPSAQTPSESPSESPSATPSPSPTSTSPAPGEPIELAMGEPASFTLRATAKKSAAVDLAVTKVVEGDIKDLSDFVLDAELRKSTPYYARYRIANTGTGDLSGAQVTLWGFDSTGTVRPPAEVIGSFGKCENQRLPRRFTEGEVAQGCLVYLLPQGVTLDAVQYRFNDGTAPFSWPVQ